MLRIKQCGLAQVSLLNLHDVEKQEAQLSHRNRSGTMRYVNRNIACCAAKKIPAVVFMRACLYMRFISVCFMRLKN